MRLVSLRKCYGRWHALTGLQLVLQVIVIGTLGSTCSLKADDRACRHLTLDTSFSRFDSDAFGAEGTVTCINEYERQQLGIFSARNWVIDETAAMTVSEASCPNCMQMTWTGATGGPVVASHCYRARLSASSEFYSNEIGSALRCGSSNSPGRPPLGSNGDDYDPLVLDLNGDGIQTTDATSMVWFDIDGSGRKNHITWTNPRTAEAFLWLNLFGKSRVDNGSELFGVGTVLSDGSKAKDGFEALRMYDQTAQGGNGDGVIDSRDAVWSHLHLWVDANHDGACDPGETWPLARWRVVGLSLAPEASATVDAAGNSHFLRSIYWQQLGGMRRPFSLESIGFRGR
jgi:hypothetical protein